MLFHRSSESGPRSDSGSGIIKKERVGRSPHTEPLENWICVCLGRGVPQQDKVLSLRWGEAF